VEFIAERTLDAVVAWLAAQKNSDRPRCPPRKAVA
jgi:hypothetical protein